MQQRFFLTKIQKKNILLLFTKELVRNSGEDFYTLGKILTEKEKGEKRNRNENLIEIAKEMRRERGGNIIVPTELQKKKFPPRTGFGIGAEGVTEKLRSEKYESSLKPLPEKKERFRRPLGEAKLFVPETKLPEHFQYLKPSPTRETIDLGKLNPFVKDPAVKNIECPGPDQNVTVSGMMGNKNTGIVFSKEEISGIIDKFSIASKIPVHEGVFKVVLGNLIFMAIVSEIVGSRFTIKKMI